MKDEDPFLNALQGALEVPEDLELGDACRQLLLKAAAQDNIVPFPQIPSAEREAFDWLAGERTAGPDLVRALIHQPGLLDRAESDRHFLNGLRRALRLAPASRQTTRRGLPKKAITALASVAALLLLSAIPFHHTLFPGDGSAGFAANHDNRMILSANPATSLYKTLQPAEAVESQAGQIEERDLVRNETTPDTFLEFSSLPWISSGQSVVPEDDEPAFSLTATGGEDVLPPALAVWMEEEVTAEGIPGEKGPDRSLAGYFPASGAEMQLAANYASGLRSDTTDLTIPEAGGAMPVMIGFMTLLLHRCRRQRKAARDPLHP